MPETPSTLPTNIARNVAGTSTNSATWRSCEDGRVGAVTQMPGRHGQHEGAAGDQRGQQHVAVGPQEQRVGQHRPDARQLGAARLRVDRVADGMLHPGVGGHDEGRRQDGAQGDQPDRRQVDALGQPAPAEDPQGPSLFAFLRQIGVALSDSPADQRKLWEGGKASLLSKYVSKFADRPALFWETQLTPELLIRLIGDVDQTILELASDPEGAWNSLRQRGLKRNSSR